MIAAPQQLAERIAHEFLSEMQDGQSPEGWKQTWSEVSRIEACGSGPGGWFGAGCQS